MGDRKGEKGGQSRLSPQQPITVNKRGGRKGDSLAYRLNSRSLSISETVPLSLPEVLEDRTLLDCASALVNFSPRTNDQQTAIVDGLQGLSVWGRSLDRHAEIDKRLPLVDTTIGHAIGIGDTLKTRLRDQILVPFATTGALAGILQTIPGVSGDSVTAGLCSPRNELQFNLVFDVTNDLPDTELDLGTNKFGLRVDPATGVTLEGVIHMDFTFGLKLDAGLAPAEAFFIRQNLTPLKPFTVTARVSHTNNLNLAIGVGFLDAAVNVEAFSLNAEVAIRLNDPNGDNAVTLTELLGTPLSSLVTLTPGPTTNALSATLTVTATLGSGPTLYSESGEFSIGDDNLFDATRR